MTGLEFREKPTDLEVRPSKKIQKRVIPDKSFSAVPADVMLDDALADNDITEYDLVLIGAIKRNGTADAYYKHELDVWEARPAVDSRHCSMYFSNVLPMYKDDIVEAEDAKGVKVRIVLRLAIAGTIIIVPAVVQEGIDGFHFQRTSAKDGNPEAGPTDWARRSGLVHFIVRI